MARTFLLAMPALLALTLASIPSTFASLFHPSDPSLTLPARPDGTGETLPFDEFKRRFFVITNLANSDQRTDDRTRVEERALKLSQERSLSLDETLALAVDLLHLGAVSKPNAPATGFGVAPTAAPAGKLNAEEAFNHLIPLVRSSPNYYVLSTLAHLYAAREDWTSAISHLESSLLDYSPPPAVGNITPDQQRWQMRVDKEYVLPLLRRFQQESAKRSRPEPESEQVLPLFPQRGEPVRFVNEAGQYEPGVLAASETAKLPADAIAIVQQLLLWFPGDSRLYWLLAELYAGEGNFEAADTIFDELSWSRKFGNRRVMMDHRNAVKAALEAKRKAADDEAVKAFPINWTTIGVYFGLVALVIGFAAYRSIRRGIRGCGPMGCG